MNKQELKLHCLNLALQSLGTPSSPQAIIEAAQKFEEHVESKEVIE